MAIPEKYEKRMKQTWGLHAVWIPGTDIGAGDVVQKAKNGTFQRICGLRDLDVDFTTKRSEALKTGFRSAATKVTFFQGGGEVSADQLDLEADAKVELEFTQADSFSVATPIGSMETVEDLLGIAKKVKNHPDWRHSKWYVVRGLLDVDGFTVLGSEKKGKKISFSGTGKAVLDLASFGLTAGVRRESDTSLDVEFIGAKGALAMDLARVRKNGFVVVG